MEISILFACLIKVMIGIRVPDTFEKFNSNIALVVNFLAIEDLVYSIRWYGHRNLKLSGPYRPAKTIMIL